MQTLCIASQLNLNTRGAAKQAAPEQNKDPRAAFETGGSSGLSEEDRTDLTKQQLQRSVQEATDALHAFMKVKKTKEIPPQLQPAQQAPAVEPEQERVDYGDGEGYSSDEPPFKPSTKKSAAEPAAPAPKHAPQPAEKPAAGKPKHAAKPAVNKSKTAAKPAAAKTKQAAKPAASIPEHAPEPRVEPVREPRLEAPVAASHSEKYIDPATYWDLLSRSAEATPLQTDTRQHGDYQCIQSGTIL